MISPLFSLVLSLLCQIVGFGAGFILRSFFEVPALWMVGHGIAAYFMARLFKLSVPWKLLNLIMPFAIAAIVVVDIPWTIASAVLICALLIYLPTFWTRVPYYPTSPKTYAVVASYIPDHKPVSFMDLGSGFGSLVLYLADKKRNGTFVGAELGPLPYLVSKIRSLVSRGKSRFMMRDFWKLNLADFDIVYAFLAPPPMPRLWEKVKAEMKPGSLFIVNSFPVNARPSETHDIDDERKCRIYIYKIDS